MRKSIGLFRIVFVLFILVSFWSVRAQNFDHSLLDGILKTHVVDGLVDYPALIGDSTRFNRYVQLLQDVGLEHFISWPVNERKAFWLNAHNAISLVGVIAHYPTDNSGHPVYYKAKDFSVHSIKDFRDTDFMRLMGMDITLNQIRDEILHDEYPDTRAYFVLVHAANGGPPFPNQAFTAANIDSLMDDATLKFVRNVNFVKLDQETNTLHLSPLLRWYRNEFRFFQAKERKWVEYSRDLRGVIEFIYQLLPEADRLFIKTYNPRIRWMKFDWSLNLVTKWQNK